MNKLIHRWNRWKEWCVYAKEKHGYGSIKRFLIFLGIIRDEWFTKFNNWNKEVSQ